MNQRLIVIGLAVFAAIFMSGPRRTEAQTPVTSCGQVVDGVGVLTGDLDCSGFPDSYTIVLHSKATLDLGGFTLSGGRNGIFCGTHTIDDLGQDVYASSRGWCYVANGAVVNTANTGIMADRVKVSNLIISGHGGRGIDTAGRGQVRVTGTTVTGNGGCGIVGTGTRVVGSTITGNASGGVCSHGMSLRDSSATGNGVPPQCTSGPCADLSSVHKPRLRDSTCEHSRAPTGGDWSVCTLDTP